LPDPNLPPPATVETLSAAEKTLGLTVVPLHQQAVHDSVRSQTRADLRLGCMMNSAVDCSPPEGAMFDVIEGFEFRPENMTFTQWMETWPDGEAAAAATCRIGAISWLPLLRPPCQPS
jgi:hypothetical protein